LKRVLIIAATTGIRIRSFGEAAEKLGVRLVFASDRCDQLDDPWWDNAIPIVSRRAGALQQIVEALALTSSGRRHRGRRSPVTIAARVNEAFRLPAIQWPRRWPAATSSRAAGRCRPRASPSRRFARSLAGSNALAR
jgi:hypothetical protein